MACHPDEVDDITCHSAALALNLGNFDDVRAKSMMISAQCAKENKIPFILDLVGVACSTLRLNYAKELVSLYCPTVIKGNISECKKLLWNDKSCARRRCGCFNGEENIL